MTVRLEEKRTLLILKKAALKALHYEEEKVRIYSDLGKIKASKRSEAANVEAPGTANFLRLASLAPFCALTKPFRFAQCRERRGAIMMIGKEKKNKEVPVPKRKIRQSESSCFKFLE